MEFYSPNQMTRPVRLSEQTRQFAYDSLHCRYGKDTNRTPGISLDGVEHFDRLTPLEQYDLAIAEIASKAPIRICDGERISGAATLGTAILHRVPALRNGTPIQQSISHLTIDFETVLRYGLDHIRQQAEDSLERYRGTEKEPFAQSCVHVFDCFDVWHRRYLEALKDMPDYAQNYRSLQQVPHKAPRNFHEAVQSLWFTFAFVRLCGNWPGIGRLDVLLGPYLKQDLENGTLTLDDAREILAHFFIKGCEWILGSGYGNGSGDAQHYQNIVLAGIGEDGTEVTNDVTYLTLDVLEELGIGDYPTTVRLNRNSPDQLVRRVAEVMRYGGGILAVYNEDLILDALTLDGYDPKEARRFANDGCWEVQIPGQTYFQYSPVDSLQVLQTKTLQRYETTSDFATFEDLYAAYVKDLHGELEQVVLPWWKNQCPEQKDGRWVWTPHMPCTVISVFERGCIENGLSYLEGGPIYNVASPHIGGFADTANSLYAIKKLVYDTKELSFAELMKILKHDWEGHEELRQRVMRDSAYYGNDNDGADCIAVRLLDDFADGCAALNGRCGYHFVPGVSTFGRQLDWLPKRLASPHGHKKGDILAGNCSPTPGTDWGGATAIIRSYCKLHLKRQTTGAALDVRLLPQTVKGQSGLDGLVSLLRGFVTLGGFFMQIDVADAALLRDAQEHPDRYPTLSVRVSGWNARFITMSKQWQQMVIEQNEHGSV